MCSKLKFYRFLFLFALVNAYGSDLKKIDETIRAIQAETVELVDMWSKEIGRKLTELSETMTRQEKVEQRIADYAEFLSYHRKEDESYKNETRDKYFFFDVDEIINTEENSANMDEYGYQVFQMECQWWCNQKNLSSLEFSIYDETTLKDLFVKRKPYENEEYSCDCDNLMDVLRKRENYYTLPMKYDNHFNEKVNLDFSAVKVATNIYEREMSILEGIRWSEPLDLVFKKNFLKDPDLIWQYFASPSGFMRHYPAVNWSEERYYQTYDFRTRSWFTEAMTSPKDIIILLDQSGSMKGEKRKLSHQIVNDILDTLNDNDFVNIYTFNNVTRPLVDCFNDTLFQANEENLRLLREYLPVYMIEFVADISTALEKAFKILAHFRKTNLSANCNQAIMLITEGIDYEYNVSIFNNSNWSKDFPVRIFTYLLSTEKEDEKQMEFIACSNMGYYVNITEKSDVREKILKYLKVMSRPINFSYEDKQSPIWSYLYVDLADRRLSNWLWTKFEGIRQREVYLDHVKRRVERLQLSHNSFNHMLLQESHEYEKYEEKADYKYMTTVSLPVYGRRDDEFNLTGVAGVDVPIKYFRVRIPHDKIGVNGYAFIITNNGYILMHPEHRTEFENILKPTFNRVDFLETEILDDSNDPRKFGEEIVKLRDKMLKPKNYYGKKQVKLNMKYTLDDMKRIVRAARYYYYTEIGPFTLGIVLPDKYGHVKINKTEAAAHKKDPSPEIIMSLQDTWSVHPDWIYCKNCPITIEKPLEKIEHAFYHPTHRTTLYYDLLYDMEKTSWFNENMSKIVEKKYVGPYKVHKIFLSTSSGLTRWKTFNPDYFQNINEEEESANDRSIDEDWYQRSVEENFKDEDIFIYSVPFQISGYENNTMIRSTKAIFVEKNQMKTPVGVIGLDFNHEVMFKLYNSITTKSKTEKADKNITCESDYLNCFILDNNAYIILSDEIEYTGRFIGDIRPDIMYYLVKEKVFESTRMFDYQATCQYEPPESSDPTDMKCFKKNSSSKLTPLKMMMTNIINIFKWIIQFALFLFGRGEAYVDKVKEETARFEYLKINKTVPTPCDREMWLFTLQDGFRTSFYNNDSTKFSCNWPYAVQKIPNTNLIFLAIFAKCSMTTSHTYPHSPEPTQIIYYDKYVRVSLPCYIATMNKYSREPYMKCYKRDKREDNLNRMDNNFCGHTWN
ncbi:hypothetical protein ABEB36_006146 [Hypothenemus hampei]|uniref:VWFA domain-containing protein n=1 Tax=Hypothenemus hampei TaxID=57062 RepID=A0ABD1F117_HYPHA